MSLEELQEEKVQLEGAIEPYWQRYSKVISELYYRQPHGKKEKWLEENVPYSRSYAHKLLQLGKPENVSRVRQMPSIRQAQEAIRPVPTPQEFMREVERKKKENESLFTNQGRFILNRVEEALIEDAPGRGLPDLEKIDPAQLNPSDLDLALKIIDACGQLAIRAANWHRKLKEKFDAV